MQLDGDGAKPARRSLAAILGEVIAAFRHDLRFRWAVLGMSILHLVYASSQYMQLWLATEKGLEQSAASAIYGSIYLLCAIPASLLGGIAADNFVRRFASTRAMFIVLVMLVSWPLLILFRLVSAESTFFHIGMAASVFLLTFPYGAMVALMLDYAPDNLQSTATSFTMFVANVLIIGAGTFAIGTVADLLDARGVHAPLTHSLLVADVIALSAAWLYLKLHWKIRGAAHL